ncbi:MAG: MoaD/ThiS family protein [Candidatus Accumulibacter sp. UW20]|jgi:molybdopterin converting factor small subunit
MITVLFFGPVAERVGARRLEIAFRAGMRLQDLQAELRLRHPEAFELVTLAAIDGEHVREGSVLLKDPCEVVFMSRFSGG